MINNKKGDDNKMIEKDKKRLQYLKTIFTFGNHKLSRRIIIFSINNYKKCASRCKSLCSDSDICYGKQGIYNFSRAIEKQKRSEEYWNRNEASQIVSDILSLNAHRAQNNKLKFFRFNEISDFRNKYDIEELDKIAYELKKSNIVTYTYTHRCDLMSYFKDNEFIIHGSSFSINNRYTRIHRVSNGTKQISIKDIKLNKNEVICKGFKKDVICGENCTHCMTNKKNIVFIEHGNNKKFKITE